MINKEIIISQNISLLDALTIMDNTSRKLLIVCDKNNFIGVISIGDIQRALLKKNDLSMPVISFVRKKITYATLHDDLNQIKEKMRKEKIEAMPIVGTNGELFDVIEWEELFENTEKKDIKQIDYPVVIMAGGKGTRLLPLTNVIPKPLIPISDKTIIEEIMSRFKAAGCKKFIISVNYMNETIKDFFRHHTEWDVDFIQEDNPLGTAGSLYLLKNKINTPFFVINCDALFDVDLNDLFVYHKKNNNSITVVSAIKSFHIPYGTIETGVNGVIKNMKEKPDFVYQINSGFYVLEPEVLDYIPDNEFLNFPDFVSEMIRINKQVGAYPISESSWFDMGNWDEYMKLVNMYNTKIR